MHLQLVLYNAATEESHKGNVNGVWPTLFRCLTIQEF